jgi:D-cysteine desulfhydrase
MSRQAKSPETAMRPRVALAHLPTPIVRPARLATALDVDLWVKRDDLTGAAESGNKVRKLELLLGDALARGADTVITCGAVQSNHARAAAIACATVGLRVILFLRATELADDGGRGVPPTTEHAPLAGNVLLDELVGAEIRLVTPATYKNRAAVMERAADEVRAAGGTPYVIPEGGSNGLGALAYVEAMAEVERQLHAGEGGGAPFDVLIHACGSGGTAAGVALGCGAHRVAMEVRSMAVCDDAPTFEARIRGIIDEARALAPELGDTAPWRVDDRHTGPAYGVSTPEQRARIVDVARLSGLVLDPVYTGKAFAGLFDLAAGELKGRRVLFLHTGGLPGLLARPEVMAPELRGA